MVSLKVYLELFKAAVFTRFVAVTLIPLEGFQESEMKAMAIAALSLVCIGFTVLVICFMLQLFDKCRSSIAPIVIIVGMVMSALSAIVEMVLVAVLGFTSSLCKDLLSIATTSATPLKACSPLYVGYVGAFIYVLISLALIVVLMLIILICPPKDTEEAALGTERAPAVIAQHSQ
ncbi:hypothetical protein AAVH_05163 [Aphelenchoides avenae]|nr:hypothetical protein AAVH_05163 [Aphelenchus avenae]